MDPAGHSLSFKIYYWVVPISTELSILTAASSTTISEMCLQAHQCMSILHFIYNINEYNVISTNNSSRTLSLPQYDTLLSACGEEFLAAAACKAKPYFVLESLLLMLSFHHQLLYRVYIAKYASLWIFGRAVYYAFLSIEYVLQKLNCPLIFRA